MNKTFNINLGGYPFSIDEDAFEYIQEYLHTIRRHFSTSESCDEIIYDIEVRMAELFQEHLKGKAIVSMKEVDEIIQVMGKPEDFGAEPIQDFTSTSNKRSTSGKTKIGTGKKLFRNPDDKKISGVCSGIAAYFGVEDPLWIRLIFIALMFTGAGVITYLVLWVLVPEATSASDKLAMRGEPTTVENIAKVVEVELNELGAKINDWTNSIGNKKKNDVDGLGFVARNAATTGVNFIGSLGSNLFNLIKNVFIPVFKALSILVIIGFGILWAVIIGSLIIGGKSIMFFGPSSIFLNYLGYFVLIGLIGIPILYIMLFMARLGFGYRPNRYFNIGFFSFTIVTIVLGFLVGTFTIRDYSTVATEKIVTDHVVNNNLIKLSMLDNEEKNNSSIYHSSIFNMNGLHRDKNNWYLNDNISIVIEKSSDANVHIEKLASSQGKDQNRATISLQRLEHNISVSDTEILIDKSIKVPNNERYRNQNIEYTIFIPEGKSIIIDEDMKRYLHGSDLFTWDMIYASNAGMEWTLSNGKFTSLQWENIYNYSKTLFDKEIQNIIIEGAFDVTIKKSNTPRLWLQGEKERVEYTVYHHIDNIHHINSSNGNDGKVSITIETPSLSMIQLKDVSNVKFEGLDQKDLQIISSVNGNSNTNIELFGKVENLKVNLQGDQECHILGSGKNLDATLNNGAEFYADKFIVNTAQLHGDNGECKLHVVDKISASEYWQNQIELLGSPLRDTIR